MIRVSEGLLDKVLIVLAALVLVACVLVGAHRLFGWAGPVVLIVGAAWFGWREIRLENTGG